MIVALGIEAPVLVAADRRPRGTMASIAVAVMALSMVGCALSRSAIAFTVSYCLYAPASGIACGVAQSALIARNAASSERAMARWTLAGALGDLAAPAVLWIASSAVGWRAAFLFTGAALLAWALLVPSSASSATSVHGEEDEEEETEDPSANERRSFFASIRDGLRNRRLVVWLTAASLTSLMDETLVSFASLLVAERASGAMWSAVAAAMAALSFGQVVGLVVFERFLSAASPRRTLIASAAATAVAFAAWLASSGTVAALLGLFFVGVFVGPHYPLAKAQAYRSAPGTPGLVGAMAQLFVTFDLTVPLALGAVSDRFGLTLALSLLLAQPIGLLLIALMAKPRA